MADMTPDLKLKIKTALADFRSDQPSEKLRTFLMAIGPVVYLHEDDSFIDPETVSCDVEALNAARDRAAGVLEEAKSVLEALVDGAPHTQVVDGGNCYSWALPEFTLRLLVEHEDKECPVTVSLWADGLTI